MKAVPEINAFEPIKPRLDECQTIRLALHDEPYPYIVPLSYGWEERDGKIYIYFHCAKEGKKLDLIEKNSNVCVEVDSLAGYRSTGHGITADYKSAIAFGSGESLRRRARARAGTAIAALPR